MRLIIGVLVSGRVFSKRFVDYLLEWVCGLYDVDDEVCLWRVEIGLTKSGLCVGAGASFRGTDSRGIVKTMFLTISKIHCNALMMVMMLMTMMTLFIAETSLLLLFIPTSLLWPVRLITFHAYFLSHHYKVNDLFVLNLLKYFSHRNVLLQEKRNF